MTDYNILVGSKNVDGSVQNWVNSNTVPATTIIKEAEAWIYRRLRVREMITAGTATLAEDADTVALSSFSGINSFKAPIYLQITGVNQAMLTLREPWEIEASFTYDGSSNRVTGQPQWYYVDGANLQFETAADQDYPLRLVCYQSLAPLTQSNATNFLTNTAPDLLRCTCMMLAEEFLKKNDQKNYWAAQAERKVFELNEEFDRNKIGLHLDLIPQ